MSESNHIAAAIHHFKVYSGDTWEATLTLTDVGNIPLDLTGAIVKLQVRRQIGQSVVFELTNQVATDGLHGIELSGLTSNVINIKKIVTLNGGNFKYDLQVTYPTGVIKTYLRGDFIVTDDITE
jgi:hypothetical protein